MQIDFLIELFQKAKEKGISTCLDTAGAPFTKKEPFFGKFRTLMQVTDLLLLDIKHIHPVMHKKLTGQSGENVKEMFLYLDAIEKPVWIRHVLVPGWTDTDGYLKQTAAFIRGLSNVEKVDVLPYHAMGSYKWEALGIPYPFADVEPPEKKRVEEAQAMLDAAINGKSMVYGRAV